MSAVHPNTIREEEPVQRSMLLNVPNPRRTPSSHDRTTLNEVRKRQKLSHSDSPGNLKQPPKPTLRTNGENVASRNNALASQESASSDQSASKWFNNAAHKATAAQLSPVEADDEPPFYMTDRAHYLPASFAASKSNARFGAAHSRLDSENEDLRGVIDDLTVENRKLKQLVKLRQRQQRSTPSDAGQQQDKLFEVRMHHLPPEKRRELEYLLKNFATSVHSSIPSKPTSNSTGSVPANGSGQSHGRASGKAPQTDSGYVSNSTSGAPPPIQLNPVSARKASDKAVKSYLKDIPDTLLPNRNYAMSQRAKQVLIVQRLEQLFTGKKAAPGNHDQPMQQQEVSQSAAHADRIQDARSNKKRKIEGTREAHIIPPDSQINLDVIEAEEPKEPTKLRKERTADKVSPSRSGSPDQRPTRPLDLDVHRAQVAAENIQYIRHLGLSSPYAGTTRKDGEDPSWVYLNLLAGLAQLHTLNVTPAQIRKAVKKFSKRFELSDDGRKVRWIEGAEGTTFAAEEEKAIENTDMISAELQDDSGFGSTSSKRSQSNSTSNVALTSHTPSLDKTTGMNNSSVSYDQQLRTSATSNLQTSSSATKQTATSSAFDYKPIFYRGKTTMPDFEEQTSDESYDSNSLDSSRLALALSKSNLNQKGTDEGLITFYNNPYFCTDLSADVEPSNMKPIQRTIVGEVLGIPLPDGLPESPLRYHDATYFTSHFAPKPFDYEKLSEEERIEFEASLPGLPPAEALTDDVEREQIPMELPVCGLGGVTPEDNFALDVKVIRFSTPRSGPNAIVRKLPFSHRKYLQDFNTAVLSCEKIELLPSRLPPASYIFFTSSSSSNVAGMDDDEFSDDGSDDTSSPELDEIYPAPPAFLQKFSGSSRENSGKREGDDEEDDTDMASSEIDMLAIARQVNPHQVAEQERLYMLNQPGGGQRILAPSLAATVGASRASSSMHGDVDAPSDVSSHGSLDSGEDDDGEDDTEMRGS